MSIDYEKRETEMLVEFMLRNMYPFGHTSIERNQLLDRFTFSGRLDIKRLEKAYQSVSDYKIFSDIAHKEKQQLEILAIVEACLKS